MGSNLHVISSIPHGITRRKSLVITRSDSLFLFNHPGDGGPHKHSWAIMVDLLQGHFGPKGTLWASDVGPAQVRRLFHYVSAHSGPKLPLGGRTLSLQEAISSKNWIVSPPGRPGPS